MKELITFEIGNRMLGIDIMAVREIRAWTQEAALPAAPVHIRGVVNLRGAVVPATDLSLRLGWEVTEPTARHVMIILQHLDRQHGLIVDTVCDIASIGDDQLQPPPETDRQGGDDILEGIAIDGDRMIMVLSLDGLFGAESILSDEALARAAA